MTPTPEAREDRVKCAMSKGTLLPQGACSSQLVQLELHVPARRPAMKMQHVVSVRNIIRYHKMEHHNMLTSNILLCHT